MSATAALVLLAVAKLALHIAFAFRYGWFRDELYFVAASKRLAAGYVDFQPVTPLLSRLARVAFGESPVGQRVMPAVAGAVLLLLTGLIARELGGGRSAQILAGVAAFLSPAFLGMNTTLNTVSFETTAWAGVVLLFARLLRTDDARLWLPLGALVGVAMLTKYTAAAYVAGLVLAIALTGTRRWLRTAWPWIGGAVALAMHVPTLLWQFDHGWPVFEFISNQDTGAAILGLRGQAGFLLSMLILPGPLALPLMFFGVRWLLRSERFRAIGATHVVALLVLLAAGGKGYYAFPAFPALLAAGAVAVAAAAATVPRRWLVALAANGLIPLLITLPVLPADELARRPLLYEARTDFADMFGWEEMARTVSDVYRSLPADERRRTAMLGGNYGEAAAVEFYADRYELPPAYSGHNSYYLWRPARPSFGALIVLGYSRARLEAWFADVRRVATIRNRFGIENPEFGRPVFVVRGPKLPWAEIFERTKDFSA